MLLSNINMRVGRSAYAAERMNEAVEETYYAKKEMNRTLEEISGRLAKIEEHRAYPITVQSPLEDEIASGPERQRYYERRYQNALRGK